MRTTIVTLLSAYWLSGCAPLLSDLQDLNAQLRAVNSSLSTSTPSVHTVTATAENVCNPAAFEEAFKREYTHSWNDVIRVKESYYQVELKQNPQDTAARHNYALYHSKRLEGMKYGTSGYGTGSDDPCVVQSYSQGKLAGGRAADRDIGELESQEI